MKPCCLSLYVTKKNEQKNNTYQTNFKFAIYEKSLLYCDTKQISPPKRKKMADVFKNSLLELIVNKCSFHFRLLCLQFGQLLQPPLTHPFSLQLLLYHFGVLSI